MLFRLASAQASHQAVNPFSATQAQGAARRTGYAAGTMTSSAALCSSIAGNFVLKLNTTTARASAVERDVIVTL